MANTVTITQMQDVNGNPIAPLTPEEAIYDSNGTRLNQKMANIKDYIPVVTTENNGLMSAEDKRAIVMLNGVLYNNSLRGNQIVLFDNTAVAEGDIVTFEVDKTYSQGGITIQTQDKETTISFTASVSKEVIIPDKFVKAVSTWEPSFDSLKVVKHSLLDDINKITEDVEGVKSDVEDIKSEQGNLPKINIDTKNLADPNLQTLGYVQNVQTVGSKVSLGNANENFRNTGYIPVEPNTEYAVSFDMGTIGNSSVLIACFCDADKKVIEYFNITKRVYTTPTDCKYIIFTIKFMEGREIKNIQVEKGSLITEFVPANHRYWGFDALPLNLEESVEEAKKIPKISVVINGIIYEGSVKGNGITVFDNTLVSGGDIVIFEADKTYSTGAIDLIDLEGTVLNTLLFTTSSKTEATIPNNFFRAVTKWGFNFQSLLVTLKGSVVPSLRTLEVGLESVTQKVEEGKSTQLITIANSDKIGFFSNSFLNGYCMKGKHVLDNLSMWSDYLFYNYGKSGDDMLECLNRVNRNDKFYGDVPVQDWGLTYGVIAMKANDGGLYQADKESYFENTKKLAEAVKALGAVPILGTEHTDSPYYYGLTRLSKEQGYMFMNWAKVAQSLYNTQFKPFWYNGHPATRTHWMWTYGMKKYLDTLPRPIQSIKLFRVRPGVDIANLQNLIYTDNISRSNRFIEIEKGVAVLTDDTEKYFDRLNEGGSYTVSINEYQIIQAKTGSVSMGSFALVECVTPYDRNSLKNLTMNLSATGVTELYIKKIINLANPLPSSSYIAFGVVSGSDKLLPGMTFNVTSGVFNSELIGTYTVEGVVGDIVITTTSSDNKTVSGTDNPVISIDGVVLKGSYKYPSAEYLVRMKLPLGEWVYVPVGTNINLTNYLNDCVDYDKVSILLVGDNISLSDITFEVEGTNKKPSHYSSNVIDIKNGTTLLEDSLLDDGTKWENINLMSKYTPVVDPVTGASEALPKGISTVRVLNAGESLTQALKVASLSNSFWENNKLQIRVIARYFPDYVDSDAKWANSVVKQGSYDCATMSVTLGDNSKVTSQEVGLYWGMFIFDVEYFGGDQIKVLCENKSLQIAKVEVVSL